MKIKKVLASLLAATMTLTQMTAGVSFPTAAPIQVAVAEDSTSVSVGAATDYFYQQISTEAQVFYKAIQNMHDNSILKTGNGDYDMVTNGDITQAQAEAYATNGAAALALFGQARDAFYMDHTDIFYVDISSLSIRVTHDGKNYHVYIGTGRRDSYYATGYTDTAQVDGLLANYNAAVAKIADEAKNVTVKEGESLTAKQVEYVHDYLTQHTSYRLENACKPENLGFIRTAYGALVAGEAVCEGYARAFKAVMDALGIPCVLVNGVYRHGQDQVELHMWAEVQIDGLWYGVDATMDDPKSPTVSYASNSTGLDGYESHEYLLVGSVKMDEHHAVSGFISDANFEFGYPSLTVYNYGVKMVYDDGDLNVRYSQDGELDGERVDVFYLSYKGMGVMKAREQGYYLLCNDENTGWVYIAPEYYPALVDSDTELLYPLTAQIDDVQFAVTDIPFEMTTLGEYEIIDQIFYGTEDDFLEASGVYYNSEGGYEPPPYPKTVTPAMTSKLYTDISGGVFHVSITYNDNLVAVEGEKQGVVFDTTGPTAAIDKGNTKIENFAWDGEHTVTFDFIPSKMFADNNAFYEITLSGLVGEKSGKAPFPVSYLAGGTSSFCCMRANGFNWNVFGQPALIDNTDISTNDWKTADGEPVDEMLKHRMVLVASSTTPEQTDAMNDLIDGQNTGKVLKSETYNISLTVCKMMVIKAGEGVRVSLGFPEGYGPEDAGVTFKAYHFMKDDNGNVTGVEEIPCIITQYGLIIECRSFSPFAVVAVEDDGTQSSAKSFAVVSTTGGQVSGGEGIVSLAEAESRTLMITPDAGYVIESVSVDGKAVDVTASGMELAVGYEDISGSSAIVEVNFTAESVIQKEAERNETPVEIDAMIGQPAMQEPETTPVETTTEPTTTTSTSTTTSSPETTTSTSVSTTTTTTTTSTSTTTTTTGSTVSDEPTVTTTVIPGEETENGRTVTRVIVTKQDGTYDLYLLYAIDSLKYDSAGFAVSNGEKTVERLFDTVYRSVMIEGVEFSAEELGGTYLIAFRVTNVTEKLKETITATPILTNGTKQLKMEITNEEETV